MSDNSLPNLEGWQTESAIGSGSFSTVYRIRRSSVLDLEETAALKELVIPQDENEVRLLRLSGMDDKRLTDQFRKQVDSFIQEYKLMMALKNCPNIVHCQDFQVLPRGVGFQILLRMELLTPLAEAWKQNVLTEQDVIQLGCHMCTALDACHQKGILHRDVKPQNIFVAPDGCYKLGDFGIARIMDKADQATSGVGTYNFMAPEVYNNQPYDARADLYSLGLVLYNLLNQNRGPFLPQAPTALKADHYVQARHRRFSGEPLPPPLSGSDGLKAIVLKACAFAPRNRYASAKQMLRDLNALTQGETDSLLALLPAESDGVSDPDKTIVTPKRRSPSKKQLLSWIAAAVLAMGGLLFLALRLPAAKQATPLTMATEQAAAPTLPLPQLGQDPGIYDAPVELGLTHPDPDAVLYVTIKRHKIDTPYSAYQGSAYRERQPTDPIISFSSDTRVVNQLYTKPITLTRGSNEVYVYAVKGALVSEVVSGLFELDYDPDLFP